MLNVSKQLSNIQGKSANTNKPLQWIKQANEKDDHGLNRCRNSCLIHFNISWTCMFVTVLFLCGLTQTASYTYLHFSYPIYIFIAILYPHICIFVMPLWCLYVWIKLNLNMVMLCTHQSNEWVPLWVNF